MEIINLFILMSIYYLIYFLEFYQRFLLIVGSSMFVSLLTHVQVVEEKSKDPNEYRFIYITLHNIIKLTLFTSSLCNTFYNNLFKIEFINSGYNYLKKVNSFYVIGRNKILTKLSGIIFSAVIPFSSLGMLAPRPNIENTNKIEIKDNSDMNSVFKDNSDMNNFLDNLVKEKTI